MPNALLQRRGRLVAVCLLGLAMSFCGSSAGIAKKHKQHASACQKLKKHGKDIAPSRKLVTVVRGNDETGRIRACVLPRGKVRTLASWDDGLGRDGGGVADTGGTWVLVVESHSDQYGGFSRSLTRVEVRRNRSSLLSAISCYFDECSPGGSDFGAAGIGPSGAGAYELIDASGTTTLQAFNPAGALTKLAEGAVDALRVTRTQITWTQSGVPHTAPLPR